LGFLQPAHGPQGRRTARTGEDQPKPCIAERPNEAATISTTSQPQSNSRRTGLLHDAQQGRSRAVANLIDAHIRKTPYPLPWLPSNRGMPPRRGVSPSFSKLSHQGGQHAGSSDLHLPEGWAGCNAVRMPGCHSISHSLRRLRWRLTRSAKPSPLPRLIQHDFSKVGRQNCT
jgi:hypothetical protein